MCNLIELNCLRWVLWIYTLDLLDDFMILICRTIKNPINTKRTTVQFYGSIVIYSLHINLWHTLVSNGFLVASQSIILDGFICVSSARTLQAIQIIKSSHEMRV